MSEDTPTILPPPATPQPKQPAFGRVAAALIGAAIAVLLVLVVFPGVASLHRDYRDLQQFQEDQENENEANDSDVEFLASENQALRERILSLENCGQMQTYDASVNGCRSNLDPTIVFPTIQELMDGMTQLPETDLVEGMDLCLPEETYIPNLDVCQTPNGDYMMPLPDVVDSLPTTIPPPPVTPPTTVAPPATLPPQGVWDCAFDETWDVGLQDCVPVTTTTWPEPPPTTIPVPQYDLPPITMEECIESGGEVRDGMCDFN